MINSKKQVELLAPVGSKESLEAAVQNGADAVYLSGYKYGARANASNFDLEELKEAVEYCHLRNVKVFCTINTLIYKDEVEDFVEYVGYLCDIGIDAVILQDIGMANIVKSKFPKLEIHSSTQMSIMNTLDSLLAKDMGFKRIVVARENTALEIKNIKENTDLDIEAFVHGALCVSYSGKCLSSFIQGGRSGNRGDCAQPCRLKSDIITPDNQKLFSDANFLSTKDLSTIKDVEILLDSGIDSFKIEGRMRRSEYVAITVGNYRKAIDLTLEKQSADLASMELENKYVFNREYTKGYLLSEYPKDIVSHNSPRNKGIEAGKVLEINRKSKRITLELLDDLTVGDGLSLGETVGRILDKNNKQRESAKKGEIIYLDFVGKAEVNQIVFKTYNSLVMKKASQSLEKEFKRIGLSFELKLKIGEHPWIKGIDEDGNSVELELEEITVEKAQNQATNEEVIKRQLGKLESTVFILDNLDLDIDPTCRVSISDLNKIRRSIIELISKKRIQVKSIESMDYNLNNIKSNKRGKASNKDILISIKAFNEKQSLAGIDMKVNNLILPDFDLYIKANEYKKLKESKTNLWLATPSVLKDGDIKEIQEFILKHNPNLLTSSLGLARWFKEFVTENQSDKKVSIDYMGNILNPWSMEFTKNLLGETLYSIAPSLELIKEENGLKNLVETFDFTEVIVALHPQMMITEYCPFKKENKMCASICKMDGNTLIPERGVEQIFKRDLNCKLSLYSQKLQTTSKLTIFETLNKGATKFRLDLLNEDYATTKDLINNMKNLLK